jgi:hypothetical protein
LSFRPNDRFAVDLLNDETLAPSVRRLNSHRVPGLQWTVCRRSWTCGVTERSNAATEERLKSGHAVGGLSIV